MDNWISVEERLPTAYEEVLVYGQFKEWNDDHSKKEKGQLGWGRGVMHVTEFGTWWCGFYPMPDVGGWNLPTHWQPLPEPPA